MKTIIYILIAVLLLPVAFASREGNLGVFAWVGIIFLIFTLVALNVREAAARRRPSPQ